MVKQEKKSKSFPGDGAGEGYGRDSKNKINKMEAISIHAQNSSQYKKLRKFWAAMALLKMFIKWFYQQETKKYLEDNREISNRAKYLVLVNFLKNEKVLISRILSAVFPQ